MKLTLEHTEAYPNSNQRKVTVYENSDHHDMASLCNMFSAAALAMGYHPDLIAEYLTTKEG